jgi:hypothetical protein
MAQQQQPSQTFNPQLQFQQQQQQQQQLTFPVTQQIEAPSVSVLQQPTTVTQTVEVQQHQQQP